MGQKQKIQHRTRHLLDQGRAMLMLMEVADESRSARSKKVLVSNVENDTDSGILSAKCRSMGSEKSYTTRIHFSRGERIKSYDCECYDSKNGACKHTLALLRHNMKAASKEYKTLNSLLEIM